MSTDERWPPKLPTEREMEHRAYLVARGVQEIASFDGAIGYSPGYILRKLKRAAKGRGAIPYVFASPDDLRLIHYGYAGHTWSRDLYTYLFCGGDEALVAQYVQGMLHGYSGDAIQAYTDKARGYLVGLQTEEAG